MSATISATTYRNSRAFGHFFFPKGSPMRCPLMAHSGLFELARLTSAIGGKADTPERVYEYTT